MTETKTQTASGLGVSTQTVTVRSNGTKKQVPFSTGLTPARALEMAEIRAGLFSKLFVNGEQADKNGQLKPDDVVTVSPRVSNGC